MAQSVSSQSIVYSARNPAAIKEYRTNPPLFAPWSTAWSWP